MKTLKRAVSLFLSFTMVITAFFIFDIDQFKAKAASTYFKVYDTEYYYPAGTKFIEYLGVFYSTKSWAKAIEGVAAGGYTLIDKDLNAGAGGNWIAMGYKTTTDISRALHSVRFWHGGGEPADVYSMVLGHSCRFWRVGVNHGSSSYNMTDPNSLLDGSVDLNRDAGGDYIYTYATRDPHAGGPITSVLADTISQQGGYVTSVRFDDPSSISELNRGAHGEYIYFHYKSALATVDSALLRSEMNVASQLLDNAGKYTAQTVQTLRSCFNAALNIVTPLNSYGASTYSQTQINSVCSNLTKAIDNLKVRVTFSGNGGTPQPASADFTIGRNASLRWNVDDRVHFAEKTGYTFKGWSAEKNAQSGTQAYDLTQNMTVYAVWEVNKYFVDYFGNGSTGGATTTTNHTYDEEKKLSVNGFTKTGYHFTGWNTLGNGSGTPYEGGQSVINIADAANARIALYAQWEANPYAVVYNGNGAAGGATASSTHIYDSEKNLTANGYTKTGYVFAGWAATPDGSAIYSDGAVVKNLTSEDGGVINLYAKWRKDVFSLVYNANKPSNAASNVSNVPPSAALSYDTDSAISALKPALTGWQFRGWAAAADGNAVYSASDVLPVSTVNNFFAGSGAGRQYNLYARWTANTYSVNYNKNGGTGTQMAGTKHVYDTAGNLSENTYAKAGYDFAGWALSANGAAVYNDGASVKNLTAENGGTVTLYAKWSARSDVPYTVKVYVMDGSGLYPTNTPEVFSLHASAGSVVSVNPASYYPDASGEFKCDAAKSVLSGTVSGSGSLELLVYIERAKHTVTYNYAENGGSYASASGTQVYYQGKIDLSPVAGKVNWNFAGWNTDKTATAGLPELVMGKADVTLYAIYKCTPAVTFYYIDGTEWKAINQTKTVYNSASSVKITVPVIAEDNTLNGLAWVKNGFSDSAVYNGSSTGLAAQGAEITVTGVSNVTQVKYYMCYTAQITLSYRENDFSGVPGAADSTQITYMIANRAGGKQTPAMFSVKSAVKQGNVLLGWAETANSAQADYVPGEWLTLYADKTVYAMWLDNAQAQAKPDPQQFKPVKISVVTGVKVLPGGMYTETAEEKPAVYKNLDAYTKAYNDYKEKFLQLTLNASNGKSAEFVSELKRLTQALADFEIPFAEVYTNYLDAFEIDADGIAGAAAASGVYSLADLNLNHYAFETLDSMKQTYSFAKSFAGKAALGESSVAGQTNQQTVNNAVVSLCVDFMNKQQTESAGPKYNIYETKQAISDSGLISETEITGMNYVYAGRDGATYYCCTSSRTPKLVISVDDIAQDGRASYPTRAASVSVDESENTVGGHRLFNIAAGSSLYDVYTNAGMGVRAPSDGTGKGADYYNEKQIIVLEPEFKAGCADSCTVSYEIAAQDDAFRRNTADFAAVNGISDPSKLSAGDKPLGEEQKLKIVISYRETEENGMYAYGDEIAAGRWQSDFNLYFITDGAQTDEMPPVNDPVYTVDDAVFGQSGYGSFVYTFKKGGADNFAGGVLSTVSADEIAALLKNSKNYKDMTAKAFVDRYTGGDGLGYMEWNGADSMNYCPADGAYAYVHLVDLWGNTSDSVVSIGRVDPIAADIRTADGAAEVTEDGGSAVKSASIDAENLRFIADGHSSFENNVYRTSGNSVRLNAGEANKRYTLEVCDNAGNISNAAVTSDENGEIMLTVEDLRYIGGVYTFTLNGVQVNLYDAVASEKFKLTNGAKVITKGGVEYLVGLKTKLTKSALLNNYMDYENVTVTVQSSAGSKLYIGTGSTVTVTSNLTGEVLYTYVVVIYGDINGDGNINAADRTELSGSLGGTSAPLAGANKVAGNINGDLFTNTKDVNALTTVLNGTTTIDQSTGKLA